MPRNSPQRGNAWQGEDVGSSAMTNTANPLERRLRLSGLLLILALLTEVISLFWARPLSFLVLIGIGGVLLVLGLAAYLLSLVPAKHPPES